LLLRSDLSAYGVSVLTGNKTPASGGMQYHGPPTGGLTTLFGMGIGEIIRCEKQKSLSVS
jgi:hypothetical protein